MSDQTITAISGVIAAAIAAIGGGWWGRRKGAADAAEGNARADVLVSTEARAIVADLRGALALETTDRRRLEDEVEKLRVALAEEHRLRVWLEHRIAEMERAMRRAGIALPDDTPPHGTPTKGGTG